MGNWLLPAFCKYKVLNSVYLLRPYWLNFKPKNNVFLDIWKTMAKKTVKFLTTTYCIACLKPLAIKLNLIDYQIIVAIKLHVSVTVRQKYMRP